MHTVNRLALAFVTSVGICAGAAWAADAPAPAKAPAASPAQTAAAPAKIAASDRWFTVGVHPPEAGANDKELARGWLRIKVAESGQADAPVLVTYDMQIAAQGQTFGMTMENLCLNDESLSPVKCTAKITEPGATAPTTTASVSIVRPDPKSTAGKATTGGGAEWTVKEHTVLFFAPIDLVTRMEFDKEKTVTVACMEVDGGAAFDAVIRYAGEEELEINGTKQKLNKFLQNDGTGPHAGKYWVNAKHEFVRADVQGAVLTATTEAEAKKAIPADAAATAAPEPPKREAAPGSTKETLK